MNETIVFHNDIKRVIKEIEENCFIMEGKSQYLKWSISNPPNSVEFDKGPKLIIGNDFYNKGKINKLEPIKSEDSSNKAVKVTTHPRT